MAGTSDMVTTRVCTSGAIFSYTSAENLLVGQASVAASTGSEAATKSDNDNARM